MHDVTTETQLRALDEKITPLYEYLGQHHAADIMIGEGPIEMALRLLRQHDEQHRTALGGIVPELTCRFEYDRRAADGVTATCRTHGDQVTGTADEITDWEDQHTANRIGARHVPPSRAHSRAREAEPTVAAWERIPYVERRGRLWAGCAVEPVVLLAEVPEEDPVPDEVWNAVVDAVPITAVTEALAEPADAAWNVCGLVERGVRAALAAVDQAHRAELA